MLTRLNFSQTKGEIKKFLDGIDKDQTVQNFIRPGNPSQGIPLPIGIVSCLFRQKCCFVCPLYIAESAKTTSFPSIYRDCLSHGVNAFLSSKLSSSKRHGIARVLQSFNN